MSELVLRPEKIELTADDGHLVFSTDLPMMAVAAKFTGTLDIPAHPPEVSNSANHQTDYFIGTVPDAARRVIGWGRLAEPSLYLPANRPFDLSGGVVLAGNAIKASSFAQIISLWTCIQPVIIASALYLRETWFNHAFSSPPYGGVTIPAVSIDYDLRAVFFTGGS